MAQQQQQWVVLVRAVVAEAILFSPLANFAREKNERPALHVRFIILNSRKNLSPHPELIHCGQNSLRQ
jgi:hypothetical protein